MSGSVRFDRAVEHYDRTRAPPPDVEAAQTAQLLDELRGRRRVVEIGVGTGARRLGLDVRLLPVLEHRAAVELAAVVDELEAGLFSETWDVPDDERRRAAVEVRAWFPDRFGSDRPVVAATRTWAWHAYYVPS